MTKGQGYFIGLGVLALVVGLVAALRGNWWVVVGQALVLLSAVLMVATLRRRSP